MSLSVPIAAVTRTVTRGLRCESKPLGDTVEVVTGVQVVRMDLGYFIVTRIDFQVRTNSVRV